MKMYRKGPVEGKREYTLRLRRAERQIPAGTRGAVSNATISKEDAKWRTSIVVVFYKFRQPLGLHN